MPLPIRVKEAKLLKEFHYLDSIVSVYDFFEENNTAYIVMEYIDGSTLSQFIEENGALSFNDALSLFLPVIQSLSQIHEHGLIHRDISPDNMILGTDNALSPITIPLFFLIPMYQKSETPIH